MAQDRANIFKIENAKEFDKYKEDPFFDCFQSMEDFANALEKDIATKETPHVLLLEAEYGMGKTFFSTRFTQYLRNNDVEAIYFSVWENDYLQEPFVAFSKALIQYMNKKFTTKKMKAGLNELFQKIENVVCSVSVNFCSVNINAKNLIESFKKETDEIADFKNELKNFILQIPKQKLVIIVDELDRCRPDYAMKTLECIKHFFDIEGLFIILPTNKNALDDAIKSLHGIDNKSRINKECYFKKFYNDERRLSKPNEDDYKLVAKQFVTEETLKEAIDKKHITLTGNKYNSIETLVDLLAKYLEKASSTLRESKDIIKETVRICNNFYEPVRVEWLVCLIAYRHHEKGAYFKYPLPREHCFTGDHGPNNPHPKQNLFNLTDYFHGFYAIRTSYANAYIQGHRDFHKFIQNNKSSSNKFESYKNIKEYFNEVSNEIEKLKGILVDDKAVSDLEKISKGLLEQRKKIKLYQDKYGSDDNDAQRKIKYEKIMQQLELLYATENN